MPAFHNTKPRRSHTTHQDGRKFHIDLHHDTLTGVRSLALDLDEVPGSMGTTPPFFTGDAHNISFVVGPDKARGAVIIEKAGLLSFRYTCVVNGRPLKATMQALADENEERFRVRIPASAVAYTGKEAAVTWYELCVERQSDGARTVVHRRYREFQNLLEQVHAAFKGHHLRSSIPELPGRQLKLLVDHTDQAFVEERRLLLENAMGKLLSVPHVASMVPVQVFLGFFDRLKEHSVVFSQRDLGLSITRTRQNVPGAEEAILVTRVREVQGGLRTRVMVGDTVSKVNGEPVSKFGFDGVTQTISRGLRPIVLHFLQAVDKNPLHDFVDPGEEIVVSDVDAPMVMDRGAEQAQPQQPHTHRPPQALPPAALPSAGPAPSSSSARRPSAAAAGAVPASAPQADMEAEDDGVERLDKEPAGTRGIERIQRRDPKAQLHSLLEAALVEEEKRAPPASAAAAGAGGAAGANAGAEQPQQARRLSASAAVTAMAGPLPVGRARLDPLLFGGVEEGKDKNKTTTTASPAAVDPAPGPTPAPVPVPAPVEPVEVKKPEAAPAPAPAEEQPPQQQEAAKEGEEQPAVAVEAPEPVAPKAAEEETPVPAPEPPAAAEEQQPEPAEAVAAAPEQAVKEEEEAAAVAPTQTPKAKEEEAEQQEGKEAPEEAVAASVAAPAPEATEPEPEPEPEKAKEVEPQQPAPKEEQEEEEAAAAVDVAAPAPVVAAAAASHAAQPAGFLRSVSPLTPMEPVEPVVKEVITTATMLPPTEDNPFWHSDDAAEPEPAATEAGKPGGNGSTGGAVEAKEKEKEESVVQPPQPWQMASAYDFSGAAPHHYKPQLGTASPPRPGAPKPAQGATAAQEPQQQQQQQQHQGAPPPSPYEVDL